MKNTAVKKLRTPGQSGLTLIELLIVTCIIALITMIVVVSVNNMTISGKLNAANSEAQNVKTTAQAYYAQRTPMEWPEDSSVLEAENYLIGSPKAVYVFGGNGIITHVTSSEWGGIVWDASSQVWKRG